jgi:outer membrane protein assembly factor BamB
MNPLLVFLLSLAGPGPVPGDVWPAFRGVGDSRAVANNLPLKWSANQNLIWKTDLPGYGQSSPVVWRGRVFVTAVEGDRKEKLHLLCLDLATGKTLWRKEFTATQTVKVSDYVSKAAPTPAVDADRLYAFYESGDLFALDHDGKLLWQRALTKDYGPFTNNHGLGSSPALAVDVIVILVAQNEGAYLLAIDRATGKTRWKVDHAFNASWSSPAIVVQGDEPVVVCSCSGTVEAFALKDGKHLWTVTGLNGNTVASPSQGADLVVIGASERDSSLAVRLGGKGNVTESHVAWRAGLASSSFASPLVHEGNVYFVSKAGIAYCVDLNTGKTKGTLRLPAPCWASPVGVRDRVYFFSTDGACTVIRVGPKMEELSQNQLPVEGRVYGVAVVNGAILVRSGTTLFCVGNPRSKAD